MVRVLVVCVCLVFGCASADDAATFGPVTAQSFEHVDQPGMDYPSDPAPPPPIQDDDIVELAWEICAAETGCDTECEPCAQRVAELMFPVCLPL